MNITINKEKEEDFEEIYNVVKSAFEKAEHSDKNEQDLEIKLRNSEAYINELALVAKQGDKIVGHIMFTKIILGNTNSLALGPVAVLPEVQGCGIGGKLILKGHEIAKEMGFDFVVLLGHETYYPRFGYLPADLFGVTASFEVARENYMVFSLQESKDNITNINAKVVYPKPWGID